jgi:alpha-tubulin suppressor-like RCC1 family protein
MKKKRKSRRRSLSVSKYQKKRGKKSIKKNVRRFQNKLGFSKTKKTRNSRKKYRRKKGGYPLEDGGGGAGADAGAGRTVQKIFFGGSNHHGECIQPTDKHVLKMAVGFNFTLLLADDNQLFAVGKNVDGQLGRGHSNEDDPDNRVPRPVTGFGLERITLVAAGYGHCAAVTEGGKLLLWGRNGSGQCGTGTAGGNVLNVLTATRCVSGALADADVRVVFVACGWGHTMALTSDGGVIAFGYNLFGQLGTGNNVCQPTPERLACAALAGVRIVGCATGDSFTQLVSDDGRVFATGRNDHGQLGTGDTTHVNTPTEIDAAHFGGAPVAAVACGFNHTMAITRGEGKLYCWGNGANGRTGLGHANNATTPQPVVGALADARVVRIAAGMSHSCALAEDGRVFAFGECVGIPAAGQQGMPQLLQEGALAASSTTVCSLGTGLATHAAFIEGPPPAEPGFEAPRVFAMQKPAAKEPDPAAVAALAALRPPDEGGGAAAASSSAAAGGGAASAGSELGTKRKRDGPSDDDDDDADADPLI